MSENYHENTQNMTTEAPAKKRKIKEKKTTGKRDGEVQELISPSHLHQLYFLINAFYFFQENTKNRSTVAPWTSQLIPNNKQIV